MDNDELHRLDMIGFDERTETWYLDTCETRRLRLNRSTLEGLVRLYNTKHRGNPLELVERRSLHRLEENNRRLAETVRDLYLHLDQRNRPGALQRLFIGIPRRLLGRIVSRLRRPLS